ncbi:MAG: hypothetical protein Q2484_17115 [Candidatus Sedimenticola sp. (ex Thyasira tokunagai)]
MAQAESAAILSGHQNITWAILIFGWFIVNRQNNLRETRKEIRAKLDSIIKLILEVEEVSVKFHTEDFDRNLARLIRSRIARVSVAIQSTQMPFPTEMTHRIARFRQSITLLNFDESDHEAKPQTDSLFDDIAEETNLLIDSIEEAYSSKYHSPLNKRLLGYLADKFSSRST